jgi:predicted LPLAT superfamily acyltransferase
MKICAVIPTHNHYERLAVITKGLAKVGLPSFIIDDGSTEPARTELAAMQNKLDGIVVHRLESNQGKGAAVMEGFRLASAEGYTHTLQIDADGQHDLDALPRILELARAYPYAVISGQPIYDSSAPHARRIGRWVTHIWVWIETLSLRITDSMCGFRIYPLASVQTLLTSEAIGKHMEFDTEILVRLFWRGVAPVMMPVKVIYPIDNNSNFKLGHDNWRIAKMHTRLFFTMLMRLHIILSHRPPPLVPSSHWADLGERGALWGLRFCTNVYRLVGRGGCQIFMAPIVLYFYLSGMAQREASRDFLTRVLKRPPTFRERFHTYMNFAMRALDSFAAWTGRLPPDAVEPTDPVEMASITDDLRGGLFIVSHLGNAEVARAMLDKKTRERVTILVHTRHAENYNRIMQKFNPDVAVNVLQVTEIGPETIIDLQQRVERGEWIVVAGDRVPVLSRERFVFVPFWGALAAFPCGPWVLGGLLGCPVYLLFCLKNGERYRFTLERFNDTIVLPRLAREETIKAYAARYALRLECYSAQEPFQWYNFYDFWAR